MCLAYISQKKPKPHTLLYKKSKTDFTYLPSLAPILKKSKKTNQTNHPLPPALNFIKTQIFQ